MDGDNGRQRRRRLRVKRARPREGDASRPPRAAGTRLHLVIVDDDASVRKLVARALVGSFEVTAVASPREAVALFAARPTDYDIVLSDLGLPELAGIELLARLRDTHPHLSGRLGLVTGGIRREADLDLVRRTGLPWLAKPFSPRELLDLVAQLVGGH